MKFPEQMKRRFDLAAVCLTLALLFMNVIAFGLQERGRWPLSQVVASADRANAGGAYYAGPTSPVMITSTPYFPGLIFLSQIVSLIAGSRTELALLTLSALITLASFVLLLRIPPALNTDYFFGAAVILFTAYFHASWEWIGYAKELKPDMLAILIGLTIFFVYHSKIRSSTKLVFLSILLFAGLIIKQQFLGFFVGYGLMVVGGRSPLKSKMVSLVPALIAGFGALLIVTFIPHCIDYTILAMKKHPFVSKHETYMLFRAIFLGQWVWWIPLGYFAVAAFREVRKTKAFSLAHLYFLFVLPWSLFHFLSVFKVGGNLGNLDFATLPLFPIAAVASSNFIKSLGYIRRSPKVVNALLIVMILAAGVSAGRRAIFHVTQYQASARERELTVEVLKRYPEAKVLYVSDFYFLLKAAGCIPSADLETALHLELGGSELVHFLDDIKSQTYDIAFLWRALDGKYAQVFADNYRPAENLPPFLADKIWISQRYKSRTEQ